MFLIFHCSIKYCNENIVYYYDSIFIENILYLKIKMLLYFLTYIVDLHILNTSYITNTKKLVFANNLFKCY